MRKIIPVVAQGYFCVAAGLLFLFFKINAMNHCLTTDTMRFQRFINENQGWLQSLEVYRSEIPEMQQLLSDIEAGETLTLQERDTCRFHFREMLLHQQQEMQRVANNLARQQVRLGRDCASNAIYDIEALCQQDIIRERVRQLQKTFVDLKCSFMSFVSTVL
jgi:hypothetical protein